VGGAAGLGLAGVTWTATRHRHSLAPADARGVARGATHQSPLVSQKAGGIASDATKGRLSGVIVGIDPGHNGDNWEHSSYINRSVWNGREEEACDTTGTAAADGYSEAEFAFNVAQNLAATLRGLGATVVLTRTTNSGFGPCITQRASIVNEAGAHVAISIHADGGPADGRGFSILEPMASGVNDAVISASQALATHVRQAFLTETPMPISNYYAEDGIVPRDDLGGLNLTTVPKVMVECGNMQNPTDAALLVDPEFQQHAAGALAMAVTAFLTESSPPRMPSPAPTHG